MEKKKKIVTNSNEVRELMTVRVERVTLRFREKCTILSKHYFLVVKSNTIGNPSVYLLAKIYRRQKAVIVYAVYFIVCNRDDFKAAKF